MKQLEQLTQQARALADGHAPSSNPAPIAPSLLFDEKSAIAEARRQLHICNACRYCEGFCAVFPAMTRRLSFDSADVHYLANLCHNCGACLHACQYAPPHEFAVNVPQAMARVRLQTYMAFAWPQMLGGLYRRNGLTLCMAIALALTLFMLAVLGLNGTLAQSAPGGDFYSIFPHQVLVALFAPIFVFGLFALGMGVRRFWLSVSPDVGSSAVAPHTAPKGAAAEAIQDALQLKYLDGGHGEGCHNEDDAWTPWRRIFHHATFYGFMLCFASTSVATVYHYAFAWVAPYDLPSLPKLLGSVGGISLMVGAAGLFWLHLRRHPLHGDTQQHAMDRGFIGLLFFTSASGMGLWWARGTSAMPTLLAVHLGFVMAFFLTLPYGKFAHGVYRSAALLKWAIEKRLPSSVKLGKD